MGNSFPISSLDVKKEKVSSSSQKKKSRLDEEKQTEQSPIDKTKQLFPPSSQNSNKKNNNHAGAPVSPSTHSSDPTSLKQTRIFEEIKKEEGEGGAAGFCP